MNELGEWVRRVSCEGKLEGRGSGKLHKHKLHDIVVTSCEVSPS